MVADMLNSLERRNRDIWEGRSHTFEDLTHVIGGAGVGLLLYPALRNRPKAVGWSLILLSTALHLYADIAKPRPTGLRQRLRKTLNG